jgi:RNA polymerase sigma-70 factor (ECF subfamily)
MRDLPAEAAAPGEAPEALAAPTFLALYDRHAPALLRFLYSLAGQGLLSRDAVEDVGQEVWLRAWQNRQSFAGQGFAAWLFCIARNIAVDWARKKKPTAIPNELELVETHGASPGARLLEQERAAVLKRCLGQLSAPAAALVRARLEGQGYEEIASRLGLTSAAAHKLFHQARKKLNLCVERALS